MISNALEKEITN